MAKDLGQRLEGVSHLALNSSDMKRTADFFAKLGIPLTKTMELPSGLGQHFFFDIGNGDCLAYFYWDDAQGVPARVGEEMNDGAMHHVAFRIAADDLQGWWDRLTECEIPFGFVAHDVDGDKNVRNDLGAITDTTFAASFYFCDPDGAQLEFCAWYPAWDTFKVDHVGASTKRADRNVPRVPSMVAGVLPETAAV